MRSLQAIPFVLQTSIIGYLQRNDMHSFIRCCKNNLRLCTQYIHDLLSIKFKYLLEYTANSNRMDIYHLMSIPFVDSITYQPMSMPNYFGSNMSANYIGIDARTGNAFISFWLRKAQIKPDHWRVVTVVFNKSNIDCMFLSDTSHITTFIRPLKICSMYYRHGSDIRAINALYFTGSISSIFGDKDTWFLNDRWEAYMFWIKGKKEFNLRHRVRRKSSHMLASWLCSIQ